MYTKIVAILLIIISFSECREINIDNAKKYFKAKNYDSAIKYASSACNKKSGSACTLMGQAYVNLNQIDKAVKLFDKACSLNDYRGCFSIATFYYLKDTKKANVKAKKYALKACSQEEDSESAYLSCSMVAQIERVNPANSLGGIIQPLSYLPYYHASCVAGKKAKEEGKATYIKPSEYQKICEYSKRFLKLGSGENNKNVTPKQSYTGTSSSSSGGCYMKTVCRPGVYPCQQVQIRICN
jgi:tetratricopeptide (TPR) repeat protein